MLFTRYCYCMSLLILWRYLLFVSCFLDVGCWLRVPGCFSRPGRRTTTRCFWRSDARVTNFHSLVPLQQSELAKEIAMPDISKSMPQKCVTPKRNANFDDCLQHLTETVVETTLFLMIFCLQW